MERRRHLLEEEHQMKRLYWTHVKIMNECPQRYLWYKGHPKYDVGGGMGKPKPLPPEEQRSSEHHLLMGSVLSKVVEYVYNRELWREPSTLMQKAEEIARHEFGLAESEYYCLWTYMTRDEALQTCVDGAKNFIRTMKKNKLLGPWNRSEYKMTPALNNYVSVSGIADLVIRDKDGGIHIFDGKNAMTPNKYEDPDQLRWYALAFLLQYRVMPKRLAFFYFRYPHTNPPKDHDPESWTGMIEVSLTKQDLVRLKKMAEDVSKKIHFGDKFEATPKAKHCNMCPYESICPERQANKAANIAKRQAKKKEKAENILPAGSGSFGNLKL